MSTVRVTPARVTPARMADHREATPARGRAARAEPRRLAVTARDGLRLSVLEWPGDPARAPVLCLPGICRTGLDFGTLAARHAGGRRVLALDYAGHGESARAEDPARYGPRHALGDVLDAMAALHVHRPAIVGTSFGGILAMAMAAVRPAAMAAVALNDIGPGIEPAGLGQVRDFVAHDPGFATHDEAVAYLRRVMPPLSLEGDEAWRSMARLTYVEGADGRLHPRWDTRIGTAALGGDAMPDLWPFFGALAHVRLFLAWGQESAILSADTVARMRALRPDMTVASVPGVGHAPTLGEPLVAAALDAFLEAVP